MAQAAPVAITKHHRSVLVALAIEEEERTKRLDFPNALPFQISTSQTDRTINIDGSFATFCMLPNLAGPK